MCLCLHACMRVCMGVWVVSLLHVWVRCTDEAQWGRNSSLGYQPTVCSSVSLILARCVCVYVCVMCVRSLVMQEFWWGAHFTKSDSHTIMIGVTTTLKPGVSPLAIISHHSVRYDDNGVYWAETQHSLHWKDRTFRSLDLQLLQNLACATQLNKKKGVSLVVRV